MFHEHWGALNRDRLAMTNIKWKMELFAHFVIY